MLLKRFICSGSLFVFILLLIISCGKLPDVKIEVSKLPDKLIYKVGELFDDTGMEVTVIYDNRISTINNGWEIAGFDSSIPNDALEVSVLYMMTATSFTVKITDE